jgi:hypothetical protein
MRPSVLALVMLHGEVGRAPDKQEVHASAQGKPRDSQ